MVSNATTETQEVINTGISAEAIDFLSSGNPSATFESIGDTVTGPIVRIGQVRQQKDFDTQALKFWEDGSPMLHLPLDVQTVHRDISITGDDGVRTVYLKGNIRKAFMDALKVAGVKVPRVGDTVTFTFSGEVPPTRKGMNAQKVYTADYEPATKRKS